MKKHINFHKVSLLISVMVCLVLQPLLAMGNQSSSHIERLYGNSRFQTMLQIATKFPGMVDNVVLTTGNNFPDALAGVPLAHQKEGPLLLLDSTPELSQEAFKYIKEHLNKNGNIYILGGAVAVPDSFITALEDLGFTKENIHRIAGDDRYDTALAIAKELQHNGSEFYLAQGDNFPDALSASVLAATTGYVSVAKSNYLKAQGQTISATLGGIPLILLPSKGPVPDSIINYLNSIPDNTNTLKQTFHAVGGTAVIPEDSLRQLGSQVKRIATEGITRISGDNRYSTMGKINGIESSFDSSWQNDGRSIPIPHIYLASGENFPDALTGAVLAAKDQAPLVLVNDSLPQETTDLLKTYWNRNRKGVGDTNVTAIGGSSVIADKTIASVGYILNYGQSVANKPFVQKIAGSGILGYVDGENQEAGFAMPSGIAQGNDGTVYIADTQNNRIRAISGGEVITVAGITMDKDEYGLSVGGGLDGPATQAMFNKPKGIAVDQDGTIYVADSANGAIRVIDKFGIVKTLVKGLNSPSDIVLGEDGEIYVTETLNHRILRVDKDGNWSVLAGGGYETRKNWLFGGYADGRGEMAQFNEPSGLAVGPKGYLYVADTGNQRIRVVSPLGDVTTLAGSGTTIIVDTSYFKGGFQDGPGLDAKFNFPSGIAVSSDGTVYVADTYNHRLRMISSGGEVTTLAGSGVHGKQNGFMEQVQFDCPFAIRLNQDGNLLIVDQFNNSVRLLELQP